MNSNLTFRRSRNSRLVRQLTQQFRVHPEQLIQPLFVVEGLAKKESIPGLTGVYRETSESLIQQIQSDLENGVTKFLLFGVPAKKALKDFDPTFVANQIRRIKDRFQNQIFLAVDVCLCSSTEHGQCGILNKDGDHVMNAETVNELVKASVQYAKAGADCLAPSDMMDGRIGSIRNALDENGFHETLILSYSAKFHSRFYGPFRVAADSAPKSASENKNTLNDRSTYQIDPSRPNDAYLSSLRDQQEGADWLMVKPGMPYLDVLADLSKKIPLPWAVYEVSGEYAAIELMAEKGLMNREAAHVEAWTAFVRSGAQMIITYGAREAKRFLGAN